MADHNADLGSQMKRDLRNFAYIASTYFIGGTIANA
jgi:hypothetical protein